MSEEIKTYIDSIEFAAENFVKTLKELFKLVHKANNFKISHEEYIILETINKNPGIIQLKLAQQISMQRNYVCKILAKLEKEGYIRKEKEIKGKQKITYKIFLTQQGVGEFLKIRDFIHHNALTIATTRQRREVDLISKRLNEMTRVVKEKYNLKF